MIFCRCVRFGPIPLHEIACIDVQYLVIVLHAMPNKGKHADTHIYALTIFQKTTKLYCLHTYWSQCTISFARFAEDFLESRDFSEKKNNKN